MKKIKFRLKLHPGIHIPLEHCDKCKHRCENYGKDHSEINNQRKAIADYLRSVRIGPIYMYNTVPEMYDNLGFDCCHPSNNDPGAMSLNNSIMLIDTDKKNNNLIISSVTNTDEDEWYKELQESGRITHFYNIMKKW